MMAPLIEELAKEFSGSVKFAEVDIDASPSTAQMFGIMSMPAFIVSNKGKVLDVLIGAMPKQVLKSKIEQYVSETEKAS